MIINDLVYGKVEIKEPVLIELINSKPLQRLKKISSAGATPLAREGRYNTRYDHSVGVMILLKKLNAPIEEQIAGLMHDIPHTAFSHVIDYVFKNEEHEFHERFHEKIIMQSEIPSILQKYNLDLKYIMDDSNFPLLENKLPDICADRIDYTLRDILLYLNKRENVDQYISAFIVKNNEIIMNNEHIAKSFAEDYIKMNEVAWSSLIEEALFHILADAISIALDNKILEMDDLFKDDEFVYNKLKSSHNKEILEQLKMLNPKLKVTIDSKNPDFYTKPKLRYVDPTFTNQDNTIQTVSQAFPNLKKQMQDYKEKMSKGYHVKIASY